jgi:hypothetical protein
VALGDGLAELVEDLVLADHGAVEPAGDLDQVTSGGDVVERPGAVGQWRQRPLAPRRRGDVELHPVAGVDDDRAFARDVGRETLGEGLPIRAGDVTGVGHEGHDGGTPPGGLHAGGCRGLDGALEQVGHRGPRPFETGTLGSSAGEAAMSGDAFA